MVGATVAVGILHLDQVLAMPVADGVVDVAVGTAARVPYDTDVVRSHQDVDRVLGALFQTCFAVKETLRRLEREVGTALPGLAVVAFHHHRQRTHFIFFIEALGHTHGALLAALREGDDSETLLAGIVFGDMEEDPSSTVEVVLGKGNPVGVAGEAPRCIDRVVDAEQQRVVAAIAAHEEEGVAGPHTVVRHQAEEGSVVVVKGISAVATHTAHTGADGVDGEETVAAAAPAEVEVHVAAAVVAVAHKAVAASIARACVDDGMAQVKVGNEHVAPLVVGVPILGYHTH